MEFTNKEVSELLKKLGIPCSLTGYEYIKESVMLISQNERDKAAITRDVYPHIANAFKTTTSAVERCIRHAIEVSMDRADPRLIKDVFGFSYKAIKGKPTNKEFLYGITDYLINCNEDNE